MLRAYVPSGNPSQLIKIWINNRFVGTFVLKSPDKNQISILLTEDELLKAGVNIRFVFANPLMPSQYNSKSDDHRIIAIGMISAMFK